MLSNREKQEMLIDAKSRSRQKDFRLLRKKNKEVTSFDYYLAFLNDIQRIIPLRPSRRITFTKLNKL